MYIYMYINIYVNEGGYVFDPTVGVIPRDLRDRWHHSIASNNLKPPFTKKIDIDRDNKVHIYIFIYMYVYVSIYLYICIYVYI
jgi:hypothetical protein